jgi:hypothetical protein
VLDLVLFIFVRIDRSLSLAPNVIECYIMLEPWNEDQDVGCIPECRSLKTSRFSIFPVREYHKRGLC